MKIPDIKFHAEVIGAFFVAVAAFIAALALPFIGLGVGVAVIVWVLRLLGVLPA